jgi:hypothetical protein
VGSSPNEVDFFFSFDLILTAVLVDSAFNRNEYQESSEE